MSRMIQTPAPSTVAAVTNNPGIYLPYPASDVQASPAGAIQGVANNEQFDLFVAPFSIAIGHVAFQVTALLAGSKFGVAIYSGDGLTKLTAADGVDCSALGVKRPALSTAITLVQGTAYWLGWTATDATTLGIDNFLEAANVAGIKNAAVTRHGRNTLDVTANGITLAQAVPARITGLQLRIPTLFFDL